VEVLEPRSIDGQDPAAESSRELLCGTVRSHRPGRGHRPDARLRQTAAADDPGPVRGRNGRRPHRSRQLRPPRPDHPVADLSQERIQRRPILGGRTLLPYTSVTSRSTARQGDTRRDREETARIAENSQLSGRFPRVWQVLGSNQRRLSRRFYSPILLAEPPPADQPVRAARRDCGLPPSAICPCVPGSGGGAAHGRVRTARAGAVC
jgi:hypothetical protein